VPPEQLRQVVVCKPTHCRGCGHDLNGDDAEPLRHQVAELPPVLPEVDEYQLHRLACPRCGKRTCGTLPPGVPTGAFGPRLRAVLSVLVGAYRLGKRPVQQLVFDLLGLSISLGMIARLERQGGAELEAPVEELRRHVRDAASAHIDETSWWQGPVKAWLWTAVTQWVTVFTIATSRGAEVAKEMLGTAASKVVISDRLKSYSWVKRRQFCWAHLDRDFQAMIDRANQGQVIGVALLKQSNTLFHLWHQVKQGTLSRRRFRKAIQPVRQAVRRLLRRGQKCGCRKTAGTCKELLAHEEWLWTFVDVVGVEPTNNVGEQAERHGVLWRKTSGGTDREQGSRFVERVLTVVHTCQQQGKNVLDYLVACIDAWRHNRAPPLLLAADS